MTLSSRMRNAAILIVACCSAVTAAGAQELPPQEVHRAGFRPSSAEVFAVVRQFYDYDEALPLDARVVEDWEDDVGRHEKIVFTTGSGERVPARLSIPFGVGAPVPVVMLVHGLGSSGERWWREDREPLPRGLLNAGIGVFVFDLRFHGERAAENDYQNPVFLTFGNELFVRSRDMTIQSTIDARRALDLLRARPDVDEERIAVMGYSMGAMIAFFLSALEPDIAAVVACAVPTTESNFAATDHFDFAARSDRPTLLQMGRLDWLSSPEDTQTLLSLLPADRRRLISYESGHQLPPEFTIDSLEWLLERLR